MLSSSKEDEYDRVYSLKNGVGGEAMDPKKLIQFRELEQESFNMSRYGVQENVYRQQMSGKDSDCFETGEAMTHFSKRDHHLDDLSLGLETNGSLHASNLVSTTNFKRPQAVNTI